MAKGYRGGGGGSPLPPSGGVGGNPIIRDKKESASRKESNDKQFASLQSRVQKQYGLTLDSSLRDNQDFKGIRESIYGIESVLKAFPGAADSLNGLTLKSAKEKLGTYASAALRGKVITLNDSWYRDFRNVDLTKRFDAGWSPKNSSGQSVAIHEAGHLLVSAIANKNNTLDVNGIAKRIAKNALQTPVMRNEMKRRGMRSTAIWGAAGTISGYAQRSGSYHEIIAEAVSDYMSNGSRASTFSRAVVRELKKELK